MLWASFLAFTGTGDMAVCEEADSRVGCVTLLESVIQSREIRQIAICRHMIVVADHMIRAVEEFQGKDGNTNTTKVRMPTMRRTTDTDIPC